MANLGFVYSVSSGVVLRTINAPDDAYLDKVEAILDPRMAMYRIPKDAVGADERNCPQQEVLIDYVNNSKNPPKITLRVADTIAILDADSNVVGMIPGCPDLVASDFVPRTKGSDHSIAVVTEAKLAVLDIGVELQAKVYVEIGAKYDAVNDVFMATADQIESAQTLKTADEAKAAGKVDITPSKAKV